MVHFHFTLCFRARDYVKWLSQHPWYGLWMKVKGSHRSKVTALGSCVKCLLTWIHPRFLMLVSTYTKSGVGILKKTTFYLVIPNTLYNSKQMEFLHQRIIEARTKASKFMIHLSSLPSNDKLWHVMQFPTLFLCKLHCCLHDHGSYLDELTLWWSPIVTLKDNYGAKIN